MPGNLPTTYPDPLGPLPRVRIGGQHEEIRTDSPAGCQFRTLPFQPIDRAGLTHSGKVGYTPAETKVHQEPDQLHSQTIYVSDRASYSNGKKGVRLASYETHPVAFKMTLACTRDSTEGHSITPLSPSTPLLVVKREQCSSGSTIALPSARPTNVYRRLKRRLGGTFRGLHYKRRLVRHRKSPSHHLLGVKSSLPGPQEFRASLQGPDCSDSYRQHKCGLLHQEGGWYEIRLSLCPPLETSVLVSPQRDSSAGSAHSRSLECYSRQAVQTQLSDSDRVVTISTGVQSLVLKLGPATCRSICNPVQSQTSQVCVTGSRSDSLGSGRPQSVMGKSGCVRLSSSLPTQPNDFQGDGSRLSQNDSDRFRVAQHALVLGPGQSNDSDSLQAPTGYTAFQLSPQQSESACLAPRASSIQEQGFSDEVAARIEAPQRLSTRAVYKSKWAIFVKWCDSNEVDFRSPSVNQIADFLLHLFKERKLQPSTIEGYRTAIADMVGNDKVNISKDENLTRFHRDKPKGRRGVPSWNLSLVLHQLTKALFEPMRKASLKHLIFKTFFS